MLHILLRTSVCHVKKISVYHVKYEAKRNKFEDVSRRGNQKCELFKIANWMVKTKYWCTVHMT